MSNEHINLGDTLDLELEEIRKILNAEPGTYQPDAPPEPVATVEEPEEAAAAAEPMEEGEGVQEPELILDAVANGEEQPGEPTPKQQPSQGPFSGLLLYLHDVAYLLAAIMLLFLIAFRVVVVSGPSMRYTLLDGDYLLLLGSAFYGEPEQGDVVVVCKESFQEGTPIVKRVIAVGGQEVDIDFAEGIVYVDGVALDEPYTATPTNLAEGMEFPVTVDEGCVFVMGDNRANSHDSRAEGAIPQDLLVGRVFAVFFPAKDAHFLPVT